MEVQQLLQVIQDHNFMVFWQVLSAIASVIAILTLVTRGIRMALLPLLKWGEALTEQSKEIQTKMDSILNNLLFIVDDHEKRIISLEKK